MRPMLTDPHGRRIDYLRLSVTDRCNLRCRYCTSPSGFRRRLPRRGLLAYEELLRFAKVVEGRGLVQTSRPPFGFRYQNGAHLPGHACHWRIESDRQICGDWLDV